MNASLTLGATASDQPSFADALRQQWGIRLDPKRGAVDVLVIDHAERPSED